MFKKINLLFLILCANLVMAEELTQNQKEMIQEKALEEFAQIIFNRFGKSFYNMSFNEGHTSNTLEIISKEKIDFVEKSDFLVNSLSDKSGSEFVYRMSFNSKKELQDFKLRLDKEKNLEKVNVIYN